MIKYDIPMPILRPVRICTDGLNWWQKLKAYLKRREWEIMEDYKIYVPWLNETLFIPKGFIYDMASIPRAFWPVLNPTGILLLPSLFHDFGYTYNLLLNDKLDIIHKDAGQAFFDALIRDLSIYVNDVHVVNDIVYGILRAFGWKAWGDHRKENPNVLADFEVLRKAQEKQ